MADETPQEVNQQQDATEQSASVNVPAEQPVAPGEDPFGDIPVVNSQMLRKSIDLSHESESRQGTPEEGSDKQG